jgi:4'-phosphopantetheinyl transferase
MPKPIYWMLVESDQVPPDTHAFLSPLELKRFSAFRFPKRRDEWLLGRWAAKILAHSLPACRELPLDRIEIGNTPQGTPFIQVQGQPALADCLSISHREHLALCALTSDPGLRMGADLEKIEPRTETFILDYFTPAECRLVEACPIETRAVLVTLIWSIKEAMLKALGVGLRWDTRMVEVRGLGDILRADRDDGKWQKILVGETKASPWIWVGWWQRRAQFVLTLAGFAAPPANIQSFHLLEKKPVSTSNDNQ